MAELTTGNNNATRQNTRADYVRKAEDYLRALNINVVGCATVYALLAALPLCPRQMRLELTPCHLFEGHDGDCQS